MLPSHCFRVVGPFIYCVPYYACAHVCAHARVRVDVHTPLLSLFHKTAVYFVSEIISTWSNLPAGNNSRYEQQQKWDKCVHTF